MNKRFLLVNFITFLRVIGALLLFPIYLKYNFFGLAICALIFYLTDSVDGFLARTLHASTFFGAVFDAISDKLFNVILLIILISVNPFMAIILFLELCILGVAFHSTIKGNESKTSILGKIKMIVLAITITLMLFLYSYDTLIVMYNLPKMNTDIIIYTLSIIAIVIETITFLDYLKIDLVNTKNNKIVKDTVFNSGLKNRNELRYMLFNHDFYMKNKDTALDEFVLKKKK